MKKQTAELVEHKSKLLEQMNKQLLLLKQCLQQAQEMTSPPAPAPAPAAAPSVLRRAPTPIPPPVFRRRHPPVQRQLQMESPGHGPSSYSHYMPSYAPW